MLKFFRNIRQKLLEVGKVKSYFLYAAGEILLVVAGILIALQINNWSEENKNKKEAILILKGIKKDFIQDLTDLDTLQNQHRYKLSYFSKIDTSFHRKISPGYQIPIQDTLLNYFQLFQRPKSFRGNPGTFDSMVSSGQSKLIKNRDLLIQIQQIYNQDTPGLLSLYETIKTREESLAWKRAYEYRYTPYKNMSDIKDQEFLAELNYYYNSINVHALVMSVAKSKIISLIDELNLEIKKLEK